jgi:acyl-coenzyme A synthetase/AMP-(fatty) acid ligase
VLAAQAAGRLALVLAEDAGEEYIRSAVSAAQDAFSSAVSGIGSAEGLITATSGTTGVPKLVQHDPLGIDRFTIWARAAFGFGPSTVSLVCSPMNFDVSLLDVWTVLRSGGRVHFANAGAVADPAALGAEAHRSGATFLQAVPTVLARFAEAGSQFPSIAAVVSTGDAFPPTHVARLRECVPNARIVSIYGATETNDTFVVDIEAGSRRVIGEPIEGVRARVRGGGRVGELQVASPFQALGYLNAPGGAWSTDEGVRWYDTGDIVEQTPEGLRLIGRQDRLVKLNGNRVSLDDVEAAVCSHPEVCAAVAVVTEDESRRIEVVAQVPPDTNVSRLALRSFLAARLPRAALPSRLWLTQAPFATTTTGKVDRRSTHLQIVREERTA